MDEEMLSCFGCCDFKLLTSSYDNKAFILTYLYSHITKQSIG